MEARDLMTAEPELLTEQDTVQRAAERMRDLNVGLMPVVDDANSRRLRGVITDRDIAVRHVAEGHNPTERRVGDEMTREPLHTATPDEDHETIMQRMRTGKVRRIPVVEDGDRVVGIVAQADLATETPPSEAEAVERTVEKISEPAEPTR